jgi:hypothetical protein
MTPDEIDQRATLADAEAAYWMMLELGGYTVQTWDTSGIWRDYPTKPATRQEADALADRLRRNGYNTQVIAGDAR